MATSRLVVGDNVLSRNDGVNGDIIIDSNGNVNITPADRTIASAASITWNALRVPTATLTLTGTTQVTTAAGLRYVEIVAPTITDASAVTVDQAASLYISAAPTAGGSVTITNNYALWVDAGNVRFDGGLLINEDSADIDVRAETDGMAYALYLDGGKNALVLGSNTDTSSADQLITVSRAIRTATAATNYYDLRVAPAGAVTVPAGITALVATVSLVEPNVTATGTVTRAATLHIASQPDEGGTANAAIYFGAAANIAGTTSITFNGDSEDVDFIVESNDNANMLVVDAGNNTVSIGAASTANQTLLVSNAAVAATGRILKLSATLAAAALTDGYGALEVDVTLSGSPTDHSAASSSWVNITGGTVPAGTYICANNDGIYEASAATITNAKLIFGSRMHKLTDDTDGLCFPFSLNTSNTAITALFDCNNISDFGTVANAGSSAATLLPILRNAAGTLKYVLLYNLA